MRLAYEKLGLPMEGHDIGTMRYIDLPLEVLHALSARHLNTVNERWYKERPPRPEELTPEFREADRLWCSDVRANCFLIYRDWLWLVKHPSYTPELFSEAYAADYDDRCKAIVEWKFKWLNREAKYDPDLAGWKRYLRDACPQFYEFLCRPVPLKIPESSRAEHTYLCGQTSCGKTEIAKILIHSYMVHHPDTALVIIEPSGKLAPEVARFRENYASDRLIYVTYDRDEGRAPRINPLRISGLSPSDTSRRALDLKDTYTDELVEALAEMIRAEGVQFTDHMQTALRRCLHVLLDKEGSTLRDLVNFMNDGENDRLVDFALRRHYDPDGVSYFATKFKARESQIAQTKNSLYSRLSGLIIGRALEAITCAGDNTIDLEKEINAKKIIIFDLSGRFGPRQGPCLGRLALAMIRFLALRRDESFRKKLPLVPVHVFIDECHNYVSASIKKIREFRKYDVHLTLIQTEVGAEMPPETRDAVLGATTLKITGRAGEPHTVARLLRFDEDDIASLNKAEFILRGGAFPHAIRFKAHSHLADKRHSMSEKQWEKVWKRQIDTYYRPVVRLTAQEDLPPARVQVQPPSRPKQAPKVESGVAVRVTGTDEDKPGRWGA